MKFFIGLLLLILSVPALAEDSQEMVGLLQKAENMTDIGRYLDAELAMGQAAQLNPDSPELYRVWGKFYEKKEQWAQAEEKYNKWAALAPKSYAPFEHLGVVANTQMHYEESNKYLAQAKQLNPTRTFILNYRCHNFVELRAWQEAIAECSDAIALDPKDEYAYHQRGKAYVSIGDKDKGREDFAAAGKDSKDYERYGKDTFLLTRVYPAIFLIIACTFIGLGLYVLLQKKPLLFSSRWMVAVLALCFLPQILTQFSLGNLPGGFGGLRLMQWMIPIMLSVMLIYFWVQMQGYMMLGVVDKSFRSALLSVLDGMHLVWKEELSVISVPSENLEIQVAIQPRTGAGQLKNKGKGGKEAFEHVISGLRQRFAEGALETNNVTSVFYIVMGIFMLVFCVIMLNFP